MDWTKSSVSCFAPVEDWLKIIFIHYSTRLPKSGRKRQLSSAEPTWEHQHACSDMSTWQRGNTMNDQCSSLLHEKYKCTTRQLLVLPRLCCSINAKGSSLVWIILLCHLWNILNVFFITPSLYGQNVACFNAVSYMLPVLILFISQHKNCSYKIAATDFCINITFLSYNVEQAGSQWQEY